VPGRQRHKETVVKRPVYGDKKQMSALEKLLKGEQLTEEEKNSITPEQIAEAKRKELDAVAAIRAERNRIENLKVQEEQTKVTEFSKKFLDEQTQKAEQSVFADLTSRGIELTEEKKAKIRDMRKKIDSGVVTFDNLVEDFRAASAAVENRALFEDRQKRQDFEKNAAEFSKQGAGPQGGGTPPGTEGGKNYPPEVWEMMKDAQQRGIALTPDEALDFLVKGQRRIYK